MKPRLARIPFVTLLCFLIAGPALVQAQTNHYPAGAEGVKGSSLPPPGVYVRDYNYVYYSDLYKDGPAGFDLFANVQAPRVIWITDQKILGGYYGMDVIVPFAYQDIDMPGFVGSHLGLGDVFFEPITLSWHTERFDFAFGYGIWAPTGDFDPVNPSSPGKGFTGHMLTGAMTFYPDKSKTWSISALNRYEIGQEIKKTGRTPGQYWTLEWGVGKQICPHLEIGAAGYFQSQTTLESGLAARGLKDNEIGIGPEVVFTSPKLGITTSVRYLRETAAQLQPEGNLFNITITKRLGGPAR